MEMSQQNPLYNYYMLIKMLLKKTESVIPISLTKILRFQGQEFCQSHRFINSRQRIQAWALPSTWWFFRVTVCLLLPSTHSIITSSIYKHKQDLEPPSLIPSNPPGKNPNFFNIEGSKVPDQKNPKSTRLCILEQ
jgi:hypothetical protein